MPHQGIECRRLNVGLGGFDRDLVRAVIAQDEPTALDPLRPACQPKARLNAGVGGRRVTTDVVALDPEPVGEKFLA